MAKFEIDGVLNGKRRKLAVIADDRSTAIAKLKLRVPEFSFNEEQLMEQTPDSTGDETTPHPNEHDPNEYDTGTRAYMAGTQAILEELRIQNSHLKQVLFYLLPIYIASFLAIAVLTVEILGWIIWLMDPPILY